ncbi:MAG: acetyl-CoA C-acyltransferase [Phycisphaerae bacterium]|nr:acetyl-CoA C-acyltransferase [Phycisphaerae bacterium]
MRRAAILSALRTPFGRYGGALAAIRPDDLAALVIREAVQRAKIDPATIDDVYLGAANQAGEDNRNVARMAALLAGLPIAVPGCTVNRLCASGLEAINLAARLIEAGHADVMVAGGVESMTRAPFVMAKAAEAWSRQPEVYDTTIGWRFTNPQLSKLHQPFTMGETAENVAERHQTSREDQDRFALESQRRWKAAHDAGRFKDELFAVPIPQKRGESILFEVDEHPRPETTLEQLAKLKPAFRANGSVTAGNSSGVNDGAAAMVLMEAGRAASLGLSPLGFIGPSASAGVDPAVMGLGPIPAARKALERAKLTTRDISVVELNEAFAAQALPCVRELGFDPAIVNPNGGAIAIGHPLGASGARLAMTLLFELRRRKARYGLAALCVGVGQGVATIIESA